MKTNLTENGKEYTRGELVKEWAEFYKFSVEDPEYGEPKHVVSDKMYEEFGEWMVKLFLYRPHLFIIPSGTEDRTYYRAFALAKGVVHYKVTREELSLDYDAYIGILTDWFKIGVIDDNTYLSLCIYTKPERAKNFFKHYNGEKWVWMKYVEGYLTEKW